MSATKVTWWRDCRDVVGELGNTPNGVNSQIRITKGWMEHPTKPWKSIITWDWFISEQLWVERSSSETLAFGNTSTLREAKKEALAAWEEIKVKGHCSSEILRFFPKVSMLLGEVKG